MAISQMQMVMAKLRISLAEIENKESQIDSMIRQFRTQLIRLPRQVVYGNTSLDASLAAMGEIEERLDDALDTRKRLLAIKKRAIEELEALQAVKQVDDARRSLADLRRRTRVSGEDGETLAEIQRLEKFIAEHSKRAEQAITANYLERVEKLEQGEPQSQGPLV